MLLIWSLLKAAPPGSRDSFHTVPITPESKDSAEDDASQLEYQQLLSRMSHDMMQVRLKSGCRGAGMHVMQCMHADVRPMY